MTPTDTATPTQSSRRIDTPTATPTDTPTATPTDTVTPTATSTANPESPKKLPPTGTEGIFGQGEKRKFMESWMIAAIITLFGAGTVAQFARIRLSEEDDDDELSKLLRRTRNQNKDRKGVKK